MIDVKNFHSNLLDVRKLSSETTDKIIYDIKYYDMESHNSEDLPYLIFDNKDGYIRKSSEDKYFIYASADRSKELLTKYTKLWNEIKHQIETIGYEKHFMKTNFKTGDNLPLNKILNISTCIIDTTNITHMFI